MIRPPSRGNSRRIAVIACAAFWASAGSASAKADTANQNAPAQSAASRPLEVKGATRCVNARSLRKTLRKLRPEAWPEGQSIAVDYEKARARVELVEGSKRLGTRSFESLPPSCRARQQLIATVIALALDDPESFGRDASASPSSGIAGSASSGGVASSGQQSSSPAPQDPKTNSGAKSEKKVAPKERGEDPSPSKAKGNPNSRDESPDRRDRPDPRDSSSDASSEPAKDGRSDRKKRKKRRKGRKIAPPTRDWSLGVGSGFGKTTYVEAHLELSHGWAFRTFALRSAVMLAYAPPSKMGPGRVHSGIAALRLRACLRGASLSVGPGIPELCLGAAGGGFAVGGLRLSQNARRISPWVGISLSAEIPVYRGDKMWIALSGEVSAAPLRPKVTIDVFEEGSDMPTKTITRPIRLISGSGVLVFRWPQKPRK